MKENMQDKCLESCRKNKTAVTLYLTNGFQLKGTITGHDNFVVLFSDMGREKMVYKHAISTIEPSGIKGKF